MTGDAAPGQRDGGYRGALIDLLSRYGERWEIIGPYDDGSYSVTPRGPRGPGVPDRVTVPGMTELIVVLADLDRMR